MVEADNPDQRNCPQYFER